MFLAEIKMLIQMRRMEHRQIKYVKQCEIQAIDYSWGEIDFVTEPLNEMRLIECKECEMSALRA